MSDGLEAPGLAQRIVEAFEAFGAQPPDLGTIRERLATNPRIFEGLLEHLVAEGRLLELRDGLFIARSGLEAVAEALRRRPLERISVQTFKRELGISSRWAIPLLEALDARGITRRDGADRVIVR